MAPHAAYTVRMDQESARELAEKGGSLLLLDVPQGTALGVDQQTFLVGPNFKGVKMMPPGTHFVSYTPSSAAGGFGPTTGFFVHLHPGEVVVRRWCAEAEVLQSLPDEDEAGRLAAAVRSFQFDQCLAPYDFNSYAAWRRLAGHITPEVLEAVQPVGGCISVLAEADPVAGRAPTPAERALDQQLGRRAAARVERVQQGGGGGDAVQAHERAPAAPAAPAAPHAGRCFYTPLPRLVKGGGLTPAQLTAMNLDKSPALEALLAQHYGGSADRLLGEFEFAFLAFLLAHSLEGFSQWGAFLRLLLGCEDAALGERSSFFADLLRVLTAQLGSGLGPEGGGSDGGWLAEELQGDSFLRRATTGWLGMLQEERARAPVELLEAAGALGALLGRSLGWGGAMVTDLGGGSDEDGEDLPVIVEGVDFA